MAAYARSSTAERGGAVMLMPGLRRGVRPEAERLSCGVAAVCARAWGVGRTTSSRISPRFGDCQLYLTQANTHRFCEWEWFHAATRPNHEKTRGLGCRRLR